MVEAVITVGVIVAAADFIADFMAVAIGVAAATGASVATGAVGDVGIGGTGFGTRTVCNRADLRRNTERKCDIGGGFWPSPLAVSLQSI
jgi:hypothetical protein